MASMGNRYKTCPYYASRKAMMDADFILVPYHMIFHQPTRELTGINLKGSILLIDEAHNIVEAIQNMYSLYLYETWVGLFVQFYVKKTIIFHLLSHS
jgi:chromosome transmission fidelity protein 1